MKIYIEYDSCWQSSVLDNEAISEKSNTRKFNKSKPNGNVQKVSINTILGVLYRLIGDQRKMHQIKNSDQQYFFDLEENISFELNRPFYYEELVMLINKSNDRTSDGKFIGVPKDEVELFFSEIAPNFWSVLYMTVDEVINFINNPKLLTATGSSMPRDLLNRIDEIQGFAPLETMEKLVSKELFKQEKQKEKLLKLQSDSKAKQASTDRLKSLIKETEEKINQIESEVNIRDLTQKINKTLSSLKKHFPEIPKEDYIKNGGEVKWIRLYGAALYLQADLLEIAGEDISEFYVLQSKGPNKGCKTIQGFSRKGFNGVRDFLNPLSTGGDKKTVKTPFTLTKSSGQLEINLDISRDKAKEIKAMIEDAGVSSFYLGKKGLAYVSQEIDTREVRR